MIFINFTIIKKPVVVSGSNDDDDDDGGGECDDRYRKHQKRFDKKLN